ncbi:MAG TPA: hypothetical protein VG273_11790 [Bryobacteraceae bacterium]|jgi:hypothetical protein|nr:hypothetical protein [Bryobacteraceae bacterium]
MSELIQPILAGFKTLLSANGALGSLAAFGQVLISPSTGLLISDTAAWIAPRNTQFPNQGDSNARPQVHAVTVRLGITGSDPEELTTRTLAYVKATDAAIGAYGGWPAYVLRVFVSEHDYGPMYTRGGSMAFWPDLHCLIEVEELS